MDSKSNRMSLINALKNILFPALNRYGFAGPATEVLEIDDVGPSENAHLFHFRKTVADSTDQVVAVNVKSFARPTFTVFAGHVPPEGVKLCAPPERVVAEKVTADMLEIQAHLQAFPKKGYSPFRQSLLSHWTNNRADIEKIVKRAVALLPDLIRWLDTQAATENVWVVKFRRPSV
jgi:hypothetical protein